MRKTTMLQLEQLGFERTKETETMTEWRKQYRIIRYHKQTKRIGVLGSPNYLDEAIINALKEIYAVEAAKNF